MTLDFEAAPGWSNQISGQELVWPPFRHTPGLVTNWKVFKVRALLNTQHKAEDQTQLRNRWVIYKLYRNKCRLNLSWHLSTLLKMCLGKIVLKWKGQDVLEWDSHTRLVKFHFISFSYPICTLAVCGQSLTRELYCVCLWKGDFSLCCVQISL